ncbi:MAG TPA: serine/threonine-protein kinase [Pyrinomonadaceae bacterium]|jgi:serine/threonine-protein kinase
MKICRKCGTKYDASISFCPRDSEVLSDDHAQMIGRVLDGQYEIEAFIAEGGMGAVYRARHTLLGDRVAIKILPVEMRRNEEWLKRFQREGQAARRFRHPNAVVVHDLRTSSEGEVYLVMEYVEGRTLDQEARARGGGRLAPAESLKIIEQVASVLDAAHAQGVVHRDLKPSNIMVTDDQGIVKLLDLGIAKIRDMGSDETALTTAGQLLGTPYYMSPEQWGEIPLDGKLEIDGRADVYSLGVVVYEITTGVRPFEEKTPVELRHAHCRVNPRPLEEFDASIPAAWSRAVLRAMSKDRGERQLSAGEFARELRQSLALGAGEALTTDARAVAPTLKGTHYDTSPAGRVETPQNLDAPTVRDGLSEGGVAPVASAAPQPSPPVAPRRSWVLAMTNSRGCQVSLTVAAVAVIAVLAGGYAVLFQSNRSASEGGSVATAPAPASHNQASGTPAGSSNSAANTNAPASAVNNPFLRYHLLLSQTALDTQRRETGEKPIPVGQSLQFVFAPRDGGYIYALGRNEQKEPIVIPLGDFTAGAAVAAGQEMNAPQLARVKLNSKPGAEEFTIIFTDEPLEMAFATETLPLDGSFRKLSKDEQRKIDQLRQEAAPSTVRFNGETDDSSNDAALVVLSGERGSKPVVFDIKLRLR